MFTKTRSPWQIETPPDSGWCARSQRMTGSSPPKLPRWMRASSCSSRPYADLFRLDSVLRERALYRTRIERVRPGLCRGEESGYDGNRLMDQPRQPCGPTQQRIGRRVEHLLKQDPPLLCTSSPQSAPPAAPGCRARAGCEGPESGAP